MALADIAAVVIVRDAGRTLGETLASLAELSEIVVYDNGSSDDSREIAAAHPNVRLLEGGFEGFGPTKNRAAALAERDWVLSIDADERAGPGLVDELAELALDDPRALYLIERHNYFMGRRVRHGGWGNNWLPRLYHREYHAYNDAAVHERVVPRADARRVRLSSPLLHRAVEDLGDFLRKTDRYSSLRAESEKRTLPAPAIYARALWAFFRTYFLRLGLLDGWRGLVIAWSNANGVFFKYMKALARERADAGR